MANITIKEIDFSNKAEKNFIKKQPILTSETIQQQDFIELDFGDEKVKEKS